MSRGVAVYGSLLAVALLVALLRAVVVGNAQQALGAQLREQQLDHNSTAGQDINQPLEQQQQHQQQSSTVRTDEYGQHDAIVTLCNFLYFPGALNLTLSFRKASWPGAIVVIVTDDVPDCARKQLTAAGATVMDVSDEWVGREYPDRNGQDEVIATAHTTVHFAKLALVASPDFRYYRRIYYVDSDMVLIGELDRLHRIKFTEHSNVAFVRIANPEVEFYREASRTPSARAQELFPNSHRVFSTRMMAIDTARLPSPEKVAELAAHLIDTYLTFFKQNYEQGLLQMLFQGSVADISTTEVDAVFKHYYHTDLPWLPSSGEYNNFLTMYTGATDDNEFTCWKPAPEQQQQ
eukprot:m.193238 g.193238  ORF g.193238 m.193238 type:complete len:349 (+) comp14878_c2_seq2:121-1167(+)